MKQIKKAANMINLSQPSLIFNIVSLSIAGIAIVLLLYIIIWFILNKKSWKNIFVNPRDVTSNFKGVFVIVVGILFVMLIFLAAFGL